MKKRYVELSSRERQIMDVVCRRRQATVSEIQSDLPEAPSASAVRTMLSRLEDKGWLDHRADGARNLYFPVEELRDLRRSALDRLMETFFEGSPVATTAAILDRDGDRMSLSELDQLLELIEQAKERERA